MKRLLALVAWWCGRAASVLALVSVLGAGACDVQEAADVACELVKRNPDMLDELRHLLDSSCDVYIALAGQGLVQGALSASGEAAEVDAELGGERELFDEVEALDDHQVEEGFDEEDEWLDDEGVAR